MSINWGEGVQLRKRYEDLAYRQSCGALANSVIRIGFLGSVREHVVEVGTVDWESAGRAVCVVGRVAIGMDGKLGRWVQLVISVTCKLQFLHVLRPWSRANDCVSRCERWGCTILSSYSFQSGGHPVSPQLSCRSRFLGHSCLQPFPPSDKRYANQLLTPRCKNPVTHHDP